VEWNLDRPLAVLDIEATGTSPRADRIIDLAVVCLMPDGARTRRTWRVNPQRPIPPETVRIHGISDADVADSPPFKEVAAEVLETLAGCDLCGFNILRFDLPMLCEEFVRLGMEFDIEGRRVIDVQRIFHRREPRDLTAAVAFYCNETYRDAHGAEPDAWATLRVLEGQFRTYPDLPRDLDELAEYCDPRNPLWADRTGRLKWADGDIVLNFGRKKGKPLRTLIEEDPGFIKWMLRSDFPADTRRIVEDAIEGKWPEPR